MSSISIGQSSLQNFFPFHSCVALCFIGPKYTQYTPLDKYQTLYPTPIHNMLHILTPKCGPNVFTYGNKDLYSVSIITISR